MLTCTYCDFTSAKAEPLLGHQRSHPGATYNWPKWGENPMVARPPTGLRLAGTDLVLTPPQPRVVEDIDPRRVIRTFDGTPIVDRLAGRDVSMDAGATAYALAGEPIRLPGTL